MIVSDVTVLITLINIDALEVLSLFTERIVLPPEVYEEVTYRPSAKSVIDQEIERGFMRVEKYEDHTVFNELNYILDAGESAAMTLAIEKKLPLIIDEKEGRSIAKRQGIEIVGLVGILRFLYVENCLEKEKVLEIVDRLNRSDFRVSKSLLALIIA